MHPGQLYQLRFCVVKGSPLTSSRCSEDEVSSRLELLLAAGATIREGSAGSNSPLQECTHLTPYPRINTVYMFLTLSTGVLGYFCIKRGHCAVLCLAYPCGGKDRPLLLALTKFISHPRISETGTGSDRAFITLEHHQNASQLVLLGI